MIMYDVFTLPVHKHRELEYSYKVPFSCDKTLFV